MATTAAPRKVTYGKQNRTRRNQAFESETFEPLSPRGKLSQLPNLASSPGAGRSNGRKARAAAPNDGFDVPSSDEEPSKMHLDVKRLHMEPKSRLPKNYKDDKASHDTNGMAKAIDSNGDVPRLRRKRKMTEQTGRQTELISTTNLSQIEEEEETSQRRRKVNKSGAGRKGTNAPQLAVNNARLPRSSRTKQKATEESTRTDLEASVQPNKAFPIADNRGETAIVGAVWDIQSSNSASDPMEATEASEEHKRKKTPERGIRRAFRNSTAQEINIKGTSKPTSGFDASRASSSHASERVGSTDGQRTPRVDTEMLESPREEDRHPTTPSMPSRHSTPVSQRRGVTTPTQATLWTTLLRADNTASVASRKISHLDLGRAQSRTQSVSSTPDKRMKKRLIDTLMPSAEPSSEETLESDESSEDNELAQRKRGKARNLKDLRKTQSSSQSHAMETDSSQTLTQARQVISGPKFTYGGERSHLADSQDTLESLLAQPLDISISPEQVMSRGERQNSQRNGATIDAESVEEDEDGTKAMRTIHDLRAGGDAERFAAEANEIIDDLNLATSTLSRKRSATLELCLRLSDSAFRTRFVQSGYESRFVQLCSAESDPIIGASVAAAILIILGSEGNWCNPQNLYDPGIFSTFSEMLDTDRDLKFIATDRRTNMSRIAQGTVKQACEQILRIPLWIRKSFHVVSPMSLALCAIELMIGKLREYGNAETLLNRGMLNRLLNILDKIIPRLEGRTLDDSDLDILGQLETILSILESCTTVPACALDGFLWDKTSLERLSNQLNSSMAFIFPMNGSGKPKNFKERVNSVQKLIPRLLLNISNNNERNARCFAQESFVRLLLSRILAEFDLLIPGTDDEQKDLDVLVLCLGAMLNLAECSDEVRGTLELHGKDLLDLLVKIFLHARKKTGEADSLAASQANVAYGWLAVLLGSLCQNSSIRKGLRQAFPGRGLGTLIEAVDEFVSYHKEADKTAQSNEAYVAFTKRLQSVADMLKSFEQTDDRS